MSKKLNRPSTGTQIRSEKGKRSYRLFGRLFVVFVLLASASAFAVGSSAANFSFIGSVSEFFGMASPATEVVSPAPSDGGAPMEANLSQTGAWTERYDSNSYPSGLVANFAKPTGTNRLLVVAIASTRTAAGSQTVSGVTYGGQALTLAAGDASSTVTGNHSYLYYLNDAGITAATGVTPALNVTISDGTSLRNWVYTAAFDDVNQTTPFTDAKNFNSNSTANANFGPFSPPLTIGAGDQAIQIINAARSATGDTTRNLTFATGWASGIGGIDEAHNVNGTLRPHLYIRNRSVTTAANDGSQHTASNDNTHDSMTAMSIKSASVATTQTFTTTDTWTVPPGVTSVTVQAWGGGGAGGGSTAAGSLTARGGGGGGGGAYATSVVTPVTPGQIYNITVAATKTGTTGANGANGDPSHFALSTDPGTHIVRGAGGTGGTANTTGNSPAGGAGGTTGGSVGTTTTPGTAGGAGATGNGISSGAGGAGANPSGGAGGPSVTTAGNEAPGNPGTPPGGGGSGARTSSIADNDPQAGGSGARGQVIITFTLSSDVAQTATVTNSPQTYTGAGLAATVSCSGGGLATGILTGGAATQINAGVYAVTANCPATPGFLAGTALPAGNFTITAINQTVSVTAPTSVPYDTAPHAATVSLCSGGGTATNILTGGAATQTNADVYAVTADCPAAAPNYNAGTALPAGNFTITAINQTVSVTAPTSVPYDTAPHAATVSLCSGGGTATNILTGGAATQTNADVYAVTADCPAAAPNYNAGTALPAGNFTITAINQTVSVTAPTSVPYDTAPHAATVSLCSGGGTATNILTGGAATQTNADVYAVTADCPAAAPNYNAGTALPAGNFTITKVDPTLNVTDLGPFIFDGTPKGPVVGTQGSAPGILTFSYYGVGATSYGPSATRPTDVGTYEVTVSLPETINFNAFTSGGFPFAITEADQTITFGALADKQFGSPPFAVSATASSGLPVAFGSQTPAVCTVSGNTVTLVALGTCTIRATQAGDSNYNEAPYVDQSFLVYLCPVVSMPDTDSPTGVVKAIPVSITDTTGAGIISVDFTFTYDKNILTPVYLGGIFPPSQVSVTPGTVITNPPSAVIEYTANEVATLPAAPGKIKVSIYVKPQPGGAELTGAGVLVSVNMNVIGPTGTLNSPLTIETPLVPGPDSLMLNGGLICSTDVDGTLDIPITNTTTTVTSNNNPSTYGDSVTFTATVTSAPPATGGTVEFVIDGNPFAGCTAVSLTGGQAQCITSALVVGNHPVVANYSGTLDFSSSFGTLAGGQDVNPAPTVTTVTCPVSQVYTGAAIEPCTYTVTGPGLSIGPLPVPSGNYTNNVDVGTATASFTYPPGGNYLGSTDSETFEITAAPTTTTVTCPVSQVYTGAAIEPCTYTVTGPGLSIGPLPVPSGNYTNNVDVGTATASFTYPPGGNYLGSTDSETFEITAAPTTTTVTCPVSQVYTGAAIEPCTYTVTGPGLSIGPLPVPSGNYTNNVNVGTATASFTYPPGGNYLGSTDSETFEIISGNVTGNVLYWFASKPVGGVTLNAPGTPPVSGSTSIIDGSYTLSGFGAGSYTITPTKPSQACLNTNGIFSDDAGLVSQHVVSLITLGPDAQIAAQVGGTGFISSFDAALIAQKVVGICNLPNQSGQWKFAPGSYTHNPVTAHTDNYKAIMMGDVNGDWTTTGPNRPELTDSADALQASVPNMAVAAGTTAVVPFRLANLDGTGVTSYQFDIEYDPAVIEPAQIAADLTETLSTGLNVVWNAPVPGLLKVAVYGAYPVTGDGVFVNLRFSAIGGAGTSSPLRIRGFRLNDGTMQAVTTDGQLSVASSSGATIRGRVITSAGLGIRNARILLTNSAGVQVIMLSSSFGQFEFPGLLVGETYIVTVQSKRFRFAPQIIGATDSVTNLEMIALD